MLHVDRWVPGTNHIYTTEASHEKLHNIFFTRLTSYKNDTPEMIYIYATMFYSSSNILRKNISSN